MGTGGADSPHSHAQVFCLNDDGDPLGIQFFFQKIRYLGGKPLLELRPTGKAIDNQMCIRDSLRDIPEEQRLAERGW